MSADRWLRSGWTAAVTVLLLMPGPADADALHGAAEVQYDNTARADLATPREAWNENFRVDYAKRLPRSLELSTQFLFSQQSIAGRLDRLRSPEGTVRLYHPYFGLLTAYRPIEARDASGATARLQELTVNGYAQKPGLPQLTGSWVRRHSDANANTLSGTSVTRALNGLYTVHNLSVLAGYGDQLVAPAPGADLQHREDHFNLGSTAEFHVRQAGMTVHYDVNRSHSTPLGYPGQTSQVQVGAVTGGLRISPRTSGSLSYTLRRTENVSTRGPATNDQDGALMVTRILTPAASVSAGGGVRTALADGANLTERYLVVSAVAAGDARPGLRVGAAASHSQNWLPDLKARPVDDIQSNVLMRLAAGLEARGNVTLSRSGGTSVPTDTVTSPSAVSLQTGAALVARPMRRIWIDAGIQRYRTGNSLTSFGSSTMSSNANARVTVSPRLQLNGGWGRSSGQGSISRTVQTSLLWSPSPTVSATGSFSRASQERLDSATPSETVQDNYSASLVMGLARALTGAFRYSESNPGQATHVRHVNVALTQAFGR
jgi:hypothetical protein